jgi:hypothetical protein
MGLFLDLEPLPIYNHMFSLFPLISLSIYRVFRLCSYVALLSLLSSPLSSSPLSLPPPRQGGTFFLCLSLLASLEVLGVGGGEGPHPYN